MKKIIVIVEKTHTGYSAYSEAYPAFTTGKTMDELKYNMIEGLNLYFEDKDRKITIDDLSFLLDLESFFDLYPVINASALSKKVGMNKTLLSQYVTGKKKPSEKQVQRILAGVRQVGEELSQVQF
ncbi:MAG: hypothetical protein WD555_02570 [Fulvivirga sp.]